MSVVDLLLRAFPCASLGMRNQVWRLQRCLAEHIAFIQELHVPFCLTQSTFLALPFHLFQKSSFAWNSKAVNLPGWCWAKIQQLALIGSSSSLHSEVCNALGASDGVIHSRISQEVVCLRATANIGLQCLQCNIGARAHWAEPQSAAKNHWNCCSIVLLVALHLKSHFEILWISLCHAVSLRKGQERYQWRLAEVRCLLVENYSNSRQVWSSRSFLQFLGGLRPNRRAPLLLQCSFLP